MPPNVEVIGRLYSGSSTAGQVILTAANSWYAVPTVVPTGYYQMVVGQETATGTIRWSYSNVGTPGTTNGLMAASTMCIKLSGDQPIYFGSSVASDSVNYTIKEI